MPLWWKTCYTSRDPNSAWLASIPRYFCFFRREKIHFTFAAPGRKSFFPLEKTQVPREGGPRAVWLVATTIFFVDQRVLPLGNCPRRFSYAEVPQSGPEGSPIAEGEADHSRIFGSPFSERHSSSMALVFILCSSSDS